MKAVNFLMIFTALSISCIFAHETSLRHDFFKDVMGMSEAAFKKECVQNNKFDQYFTIENDMCARGFVLKPKKPGYQPVLCGSFEQCSIGDLQKACADKVKPGNGTFSVIEGFQTQTSSCFREYVDIGALQANPAHQDAVFQVASNFNCLEAVDADQNVDEQLLESYVHDMTQGPAASISAAPGLILRRYLVDRQLNDEHSIDLLRDLKNPCLKVSAAGYARIGFPDPAACGFPAGAEIGIPIFANDEDYLNICVGYHKNIQVSHGFMIDSKNHKKILPADQASGVDGQIINQVFTAALDLGNTNKYLKDNEGARAWAQMFLNAAYEGTLRKAFIEGKRKVFLTLIGGGVFANKLPWIFDAINRMKDFIVASGLDVTLVWYKSDTSAEHARLRDSLKQLVGGTSGMYETYK